MTIDFAEQRRCFPLLAERQYFAQQCLGALPIGVEDDLQAYGRSLTRRSRAIPEWAERFEEHHRIVEALLDAPRGSVFLRDSATAAQAAIAAALEPRGDRKRVLIGAADFHSSRYLWRAQAARGFEIEELAPVGEGSSLDAERVASTIDERVRVVALALVSPRSGAMIDVAPIVRAARRAGAIVIIDAYQAVGVVPVRVAELGAHVIVGGFHKWLGGGGTGLAFGYVDPEVLGQLDPVYPGWMAHRDLLAFADRFEPASGAEKLQQGMPAMEPIYTSRAGLRWVLETGIDAIRARSLVLTQRILSRADERGLHVVTPRTGALRGGMVCFDLPDAKQVVERLCLQGIDIDFRPGAGVRVGPHPCAEEEECARVVDRIAEALA